ncbi:MAG: hypothetical protein IPL61_34545 [Myxococcales bacterium]|nr:hypothetical protein [Myxococcales bacterium]
MKHALALAATVVACGGACGGGGGGDTRPPPAPRTALTLDAGGALDGGITELPTYDPAAGFALDPDPQPRSGGRGGARDRDRKQVQLLLRSTPIGAIAAVDGVRLGVTPVVWDGDGGIAHEFTFVLAGHTLARYRFVPVTNGIVHGRLVKITSDGVTPEIPAPVDPPRPTRRTPPPIDAAPPPPPIDAAPVLDPAAMLDAAGP